jgi:hypothetical protein
MEVTIVLPQFEAAEGAIHHIVEARLNDAPKAGQPEQIAHESAHKIAGSTRPLRVTLPKRSVSCIEIPLERTQ